MICFENISFAYEANPDENSLQNIDLTIPDGECVLITGPSGCGKSTLLLLLNGLIPEFYPGTRTGSIAIDGISIDDKGIYDLVGKIGTVFQNPRSQFFNVDTTSELAFGCENLAMPEDEILARIERTVSSFAIENLMDRDIFELSGGEKQKIACASVDVLRPEIVLLDEPSANLDYEAAESLRELIRCWKEEGKTIIIAEHRINYVWDLADRVIIMENGRISQDLSLNARSIADPAMLSGYGLRSIERISPFDLVKEHGAAKTFSENDIVLREFKYSYRGGGAIIDIPEMHIQQGAITAIIGANGAGKTTFLECLSGTRKNKGMMEYSGKIYGDRARLRETFMVMQDSNHQLFTESVLEEVMISLPEEDEKRARAILSEVELLQYADRHPMSLSGGQKQRLAIACAIASERPVLLLDEPTSGLDKGHMNMVSELLSRMKSDGRTVITVTHDTEFIKCCCDDVIVLEEYSNV